VTILQLADVAVGDRLGPVTARVNAAELIHLAGPNGAGKSTLLTRMAGLIEGDGEILLNGQPLSQWTSIALGRHRALLMQQQTPPFAMPVWHYLQLHQSADGADRVMMHLAARLHLTDKLTRPVNQLSGGEWQRVRLAAVFLQVHPELNPQAQILLLDEPMNSLDIAQQAALDGLIQTFIEAGIAIVMSSHDVNHSLRHADQVWLLRGGKLLAQGSSDRVLTPDNLQCAYDIPFRLLAVEGYNVLITDSNVENLQ